MFFKTNSGFVEYGTMGHDWAYREAVGSGGHLVFGTIWYHLVPGCSGILFVFTNLVYSELFSPPGFSTLDSDLYF